MRYESFKFYELVSEQASSLKSWLVYGHLSYVGADVWRGGGSNETYEGLNTTSKE